MLSAPGWSVGLTGDAWRLGSLCLAFVHLLTWLPTASLLSRLVAFLWPVVPAHGLATASLESAREAKALGKVATLMYLD